MASIALRTGGRRHRGAVALVAAASGENPRERTREKGPERCGLFLVEGEAEAKVYICFSRFYREAGEAEEKRQKPRKRTGS